MAAPKPKFYVVWSGRKPGVYNTWAECQVQTSGCKGARFKSFPTHAEALAAYEAGAPERSASPKTKASSADKRRQAGNPGRPSPTTSTAYAIAVDAACSGNPGMMEYRGVDVATGRTIFHFGPIWGTNNIGEFLAIVHGLAWLTQQKLHATIYSDSVNAMLWVRQRKCKTTLAREQRSAQVYELIERAEQWLKSHPSTAIPILKWETRSWGEIPADFGRK